MPTPTYRFGEFELDPSSFTLRRDAQMLKLQRIPMELLIVVVEKEGHVVSRQEIIDRLWGQDVFVDTEAGINTAVRKIRQTLGDDSENPKYLQTVTGKGYRFVGATRWPQAEAVEVGGNHGNGERPASLPAAAAQEAEPEQRGRDERSGRRLTSVVVVVMVAVLSSAVFLLRGPIRRAWRLHELQNLRTVPLTSLPGQVASPTFSPDGSQMAFAWNGESGGGGYDLYVMVIGSSDAPHRLTNHPALRLAPAWSPDGRNLAFSRVTGEDAGVYLISPSGGVERKIADRTDRSWYGSEVSWSPDGKQITFIDRPSSVQSDFALQLYLLQIDGLVKHEINTGCPSVATPAFSHSGRYLAWICNRKTFRAEIVLQDLHNQQIRVLKRTHTSIDGIAWALDDQRILYSTDSDAGALREIEVDDPTQETNLSLGQGAGDLAMSPLGAGFAYVTSTSNVNIWRLDLTASPVHASPLILASSLSRAPSISPDGQKIAFESDRTGALQIWMADADGSRAQQMTFFTDAITGTPRWSPDGSQIVFDSRIGFEDSAIYVIGRDGGTPRKLQIDLQGNAQPSWSHDGRWIYFSNGADEGPTSICKVPATGGHAVCFSGQGSGFPLESFDGSLIYFCRDEHIYSVRPDGTDAQLLPDIPPNIFLGDEWFPARKGIYFIQHPHHRAEIKFYDFETRSTRSLYTMERPTPPWIGGMPVSRDGKWMLVPQEDQSSSGIMMMQGWK